MRVNLKGTILAKMDPSTNLIKSPVAESAGGYDSKKVHQQTKWSFSGVKKKD